jgi:membrane protease subunit HflK
MAHTHHHHHPPAGDMPGEAPLDAANQSLADAMRASFNILKFIMIVLVVLYALSGVRIVDEDSEAVVFRFGKLHRVQGSGASIAFPYPIEETLVFATKKDNAFRSLNQWPKVKADQINEPLSKIRSGGVINPALDGSLLTADSGIVHIQWDVKYRVDDIRRYVLNVGDESTTEVEALITSLLDDTTITLVADYTAEDVTRGSTTEVAFKVRTVVNERLDQLGTGVTVVSLDIPHSSVPGPTMSAFDNVAKAQSERDKTVQEAQQERIKILNATAGTAWRELTTYTSKDGERHIGLLDRLDAAIKAKDETNQLALEAEIDEILENEASGEAGQRIRLARGYYTQVVQQINGDVDQYLAVLDEYLESPDLLVHRLWEQTKQRVLQQRGLTKHFVAGSANELRIHIEPDPEQAARDEIEKLSKEAQGYKFAPERKLHAIMPTD